jgi:putative hydrolase of the HAD superfamily
MIVTPQVRAVVFDAGGTLLFPDPPAAVTYAEVGRRYGSQRPAAEIAPRFAAAFARQEAADRDFGYRTDERREEQRWRHIVTDVLDDLTNAEGCFRELFGHYSRPEAWRCPEDRAQVLDTLAGRGYTLAMASNYDRRLHAVAAGLPELRRIKHVVISSEVGWRKPAPEFFAALSKSVGHPPGRILFVGDDLTNDYEGSRAAGLRAVLFDAERKHASCPARIESFRDLLGS